MRTEGEAEAAGVGEEDVLKEAQEEVAANFIEVREEEKDTRE